MIFYFDENFPKAAATLLETFGHEWIDHRATHLVGSEDSILLGEAQNADAVLLTTDRDFFHTLHHQHPRHAGVVVIALKKPNRAAILARLEWLLKIFKEEDFRGRVFQLRDRTWIARPPLQSEKPKSLP